MTSSLIWLCLNFMMKKKLQINFPMSLIRLERTCIQWPNLCFPFPPSNQGTTPSSSSNQQPFWILIFFLLSLRFFLCTLHLLEDEGDFFFGLEYRWRKRSKQVPQRHLKEDLHCVSPNSLYYSQCHSLSTLKPKKHMNKQKKRKNEDVSSLFYFISLRASYSWLYVCLRLDVLEMKPTRVQQTPQTQSRVAI